MDSENDDAAAGVENPKSSYVKRKPMEWFE
jgi:hypothetical protein